MLDCRTGRLVEIVGTQAEREALMCAFEKHNRHPLLELTQEQLEELTPLEGYKRKGRMRNKPCVCGSDKQFKDCCWGNFL
ncbi:SEC-C metal-binding domain-containing protein [Vibrio paucivorans]